MAVDSYAEAAVYGYYSILDERNFKNGRKNSRIQHPGSSPGARQKPKAKVVTIGEDMIFVIITYKKSAID